MTNPEDTPDAAPEVDRTHVDRTHVDLQYAGASTVETTPSSAVVALPGNLLRPAVKLQGRIKSPLRFREALGALYAVVGSDYRYVPKDRSAYQAFRRMRSESSGQSAWQAQQAYFDWLSRNDPLAFLILDPVVSVHPDGLFFEVFSKDEGVYANIAIDHSAFDLDGKPVCGATNIDFSQELFQGVQQMRSYRETRLSIGQDAVAVSTTGKPEVIEKKINIPDAWLRGFLQVQSAATLPKDSFSLAPIDLYNVLRHLRLHGDKKGKRRGLRVELIPGEKPILVLEPWETVIPASSEIYRGKQAKVVRIWGRRRLMLLQRMLGFAESIDVHVLGSGLPSFWVLRAGEITVTLGLTGFTASNWSQAMSLDLLLPRQTKSPKPLTDAVKHLSKTWYDAASNIAKAIGADGASVMEAMQIGCQNGRIMYDLANNVFRLRPLTEDPLNLDRLEYRNRREREAHDLVSRKSAVKIVSENRIHNVGVQLTGKANVKEDKREYRPQLVLTEEGNVSRAECTCSFFRKQGLTAGPCAHLVALRLEYSQQQQQARQSGKARRTISAETRTFSKRGDAGETVYQLSLDHRRLRIRWGEAGQTQRLQNLVFNSVDDAREDYLLRVEQLESRGFLDATAS